MLLTVVVTGVILHDELGYFLHDGAAEIEHAVALKHLVEIVVNNERVLQPVLLYVYGSPNIWDSNDGRAVCLLETGRVVVLLEVNVPDAASGHEGVLVLEELGEVVVTESGLREASLLGVALVGVLVAGRNAYGVSELSRYGAETDPVLAELHAPKSAVLAEHERDGAAGVAVLTQEGGDAPAKIVQECGVYACEYVTHLRLHELLVQPAGPVYLQQRVAQLSGHVVQGVGGYEGAVRSEANVLAEQTVE